MDYSRALFEQGLWATGIGFPTVPKGRARIRTIVTAAHSTGQLDQAVEILGRVARQLGIPLAR
jgi:glycine C-acetyltransferase